MQPHATITICSDDKDVAETLLSAITSITGLTATHVAWYQITPLSAPTMAVLHPTSTEQLHAVLPSLDAHIKACIILTPATILVPAGIANKRNMHCIPLPAPITQMVAQIQAIIQTSQQAALRIHGWLLNAHERTLHTENTTSQPILLTEKESALLLALGKCSTIDSGLDKTQLLQQIWHYHAEAQTHTLETHVFRLRQKLDKAASPFTITAQDGIYRISLRT